MLIVTSKNRKEKEAGTKTAFEYEGKEYDTNPFATCNKNISKKKSPAKWERCVRHVKDSSEVD